MTRAKRKIEKERARKKPKLETRRVQGSRAIMTYVDADGRTHSVQISGDGSGFGPFVRVLPPPGRCRLGVMSAVGEEVEVSYDAWLKITRRPVMSEHWKPRHRTCAQHLMQVPTNLYQYSVWCPSCEREVSGREIYYGFTRPSTPRDAVSPMEIRQQAIFGKQFDVIAAECGVNWARCLGWNLFYPAAFYHGHVNMLGDYWEFMPILVDQFLDLATSFATQLDDRSISDMQITEREF